MVKCAHPNWQSHPVRRLMPSSLDRVQGLPVIAVMVDGVTGMYAAVKQSRMPLVGRTLEAAEATSRMAAASVDPVVMRLEKPFGYVDSWLCRGLDVLEVAVPMVKEPPAKIVSDAKAFFNGKAAAAATYGKGKVIEVANNPLAKRALGNMDAAVIAADAYVEKLIPGTAPEPLSKDQPSWDPALAPIAHAAALTIKIQRRIYDLTLIKAQEAQKKMKSALDYIHPTDFVDYVRNQLNAGSQAVSDKTAFIWKETVNMTPGKAAQVVTDGMNVIEARTAEAARLLFQYLSLNYIKAKTAASEEIKKVD